MSNQDRPLSPHLLLYRPQLTSVLSITHRMTGVGLAAGTLLLVYWLVAAATGEAAFETARAVIDSFMTRMSGCLRIERASASFWRCAGNRRDPAMPAW